MGFFFARNSHKDISSRQISMTRRISSHPSEGWREATGWFLIERWREATGWFLIERWREATGWMYFSTPSPAGKGGMGQKKQDEMPQKVAVNFSPLSVSPQKRGR
jgi:hypothetical protein